MAFIRVRKDGRPLCGQPCAQSSTWTDGIFHQVAQRRNALQKRPGENQSRQQVALPYRLTDAQDQSLPQALVRSRPAEEG